MFEHFDLFSMFVYSVHQANRNGVYIAGAQIRVRNRKLFFLFLNQNICCGYSKEQSHREGSFEHPKHMLKLMGKKKITILC